MVQMSNKTFIIIITVVVIAAVLIAVGLLLGWFKPLEGAGGVFATGLFEVFAFIPRFVVTGWPQMLVGICLLVALVFGAGYIFEQKQIIATLKGSKTQTAELGYTNTMNVEPQEPERAPQTSPQTET